RGWAASGGAGHGRAPRRVRGPLPALRRGAGASRRPADPARSLGPRHLRPPGLLLLPGAAQGLPALMGVRGIHPGDPLTAREEEVLALLACGRTNRAIATALGLSVHTVKHHVSHVLIKLGVPNRGSAIA